jgi:hypothetical protein
MEVKRSKEASLGSPAEYRRSPDRTNAARTGISGTAEGAPATIVEYTDHKQPRNAYPQRIVSPVRSGPCCFTDMEEVGKPQEDGRWVFQYKRCRKCGFALRVILREIPDAALAAELRKILANSFVRNVPE